MPMDANATSTIDTEIARRLHRALTGDKEDIHTLVNDPSPEVLVNLLRNEALDENHLLALLKRRDLSEELLKALYRHPLVEGSHRLKVSLVQNPATPGGVILALLSHLHLFELVTVCHLPGVTPDQRYAAERAILQRLPLTPLGNKITLARRGTATVVAELLKAGEPPVVEVCLDNPHLKEGALFQFVSSGRATAETISMVARHSRWSGRPNLQLAILRNVNTPPIWYTLFLPRHSLAELRSLLHGRHLPTLQRQAVEEEITKRGNRP
ncbi:MAG TPA: hypothetical protein VFR01_00855 [Geobacterales bacterium]|nr:hypothetical protein [Geobacterales bacterium]